MKKFLKFIVTGLLGLIAQAVISRYKPRVVMVSGSVGKTSTKDAIATVLETKFFVRKSEKSFNSEFGVPFTILGVKNPLHNPLSWALILKNSFSLLFLPNHYPTMLVLEVGADRQGDLKRILRIVTPSAVVITRLPEIPVHVEAYSSPEDVREEEFSPAYVLPANAPLIIPSDNQYAIDNAARIPARIISYGISNNANVSIIAVSFLKSEGRVVGMTAIIEIDGEKGSVVVNGSVGTTQILSVAAAVAVAHAYNIPIGEALKALEHYVPPPGRGRLLNGINDSVIIDDTYNSSPAAVEEAIVTLREFPMHPSARGRKIAILGDMLELGRYSIAEHERIGALARESADIIIAVGIRARAFMTSDKSDKELLFDNSLTAALAIPALVQGGDVILIKGSQSVRMERIVEAILANPSDVSQLVRQEREWKKRP